MMLQRLVFCFCTGLLAVHALAGDSTIRSTGVSAVHEWGTFTSVAGPDGMPVVWLPLSGPPDLPCFVYRLGILGAKAGMSATVRMETPVIYFYAPHPTSINVHVDLPSGTITEWYPQATTSPAQQTGSRIEWKSVNVLPDLKPEYPVENKPSHYYAARDTGAAPLRLGAQEEKLIFYRGIASFPIPLSATITSNGKLNLRTDGPTPIPSAIVFEHRQGKVAWRRLSELKGQLTLDLPDSAGDLTSLRDQLAEILTAQGLYPKEARAMVETWRDSWFEQGTRLFYIVPRAMVDSVLPLKLDPPPAEVARVFVGRIEILSPWMRTGIEHALAAEDISTLQKYGRFLQPFLTGVRHAPLTPRVNAFINAANDRLLSDSRGCAK